jgi:hypothetical protein
VVEVEIIAAAAVTAAAHLEAVITVVLRIPSLRKVHTSRKVV